MGFSETDFSDTQKQLSIQILNSNLQIKKKMCMFRFKYAISENVQIGKFSD